MNHHLLVTTLFAGALASGTATAGSFQHQAGLLLSDNNAYSASLSPFYTYYLDPVDDSHGPLEIVGFLAKLHRLTRDSGRRSTHQVHDMLKPMTGNFMATLFLITA